MTDTVSVFTVLLLGAGATFPTSAISLRLHRGGFGFLHKNSGFVTGLAPVLNVYSAPGMIVEQAVATIVQTTGLFLARLGQQREHQDLTIPNVKRDATHPLGPSRPRSKSRGSSEPGVLGCHSQRSSQLQNVTSHADLKMASRLSGF